DHLYRPGPAPARAQGRRIRLRPARHHPPQSKPVERSGACGRAQYHRQGRPADRAGAELERWRSPPGGVAPNPGYACYWQTALTAALTNRPLGDVLEFVTSTVRTFT